jgi:hypothetical protein
MRVSRSLIIASVLLIPLQAAGQSGGGTGGSVGGSGGTAGMTTGTTPSATTTGAPPPGTNSAGTAQSSGSGMTTGLAMGSTAEDKKIEDENRDVSRKLKGICKGC